MTEDFAPRWARDIYGTEQAEQAAWPREVYLKDVGTPDDPCLVPCAKGDPGAIRFLEDL